MMYLSATLVREEMAHVVEMLYSFVSRCIYFYYAEFQGGLSVAPWRQFWDG